LLKLTLLTKEQKEKLNKASYPKKQDTRKQLLLLKKGKA